jgi:RHS repeat-associated protein
VPFGLPGGDADSDGDCDASDVSQVNTWWSSGPYDVRGDIDLDGDVDATDSSTISTSYYGIVMGRGVLSDSDVWNRRGYAGYESDTSLGSEYDVRQRRLSPVVGRWKRRDPMGYADGVNVYQIMGNRGIGAIDPMGTLVGCLEGQAVEGGTGDSGTCFALEPVPDPKDGTSTTPSVGPAGHTKVTGKPEKGPDGRMYRLALFFECPPKSDGPCGEGKCSWECSMAFRIQTPHPDTGEWSTVKALPNPPAGEVYFFWHNAPMPPPPHPPTNYPNWSPGVLDKWDGSSTPQSQSKKGFDPVNHEMNCPKNRGTGTSETVTYEAENIDKFKISVSLKYYCGCLCGTLGG